MLRVNSSIPAELEGLVSRTIGCAIRVHKTLGPGFKEGIYHDAVCIDLELEGIHYEREVKIAMTYRDRPLRSQRIDLLVEGRLIMELKSIEKLDRIHQAQVLSYMKAAGVPVGLLMNFNVEYLPQALRRFVL